MSELDGRRGGGTVWTLDAVADVQAGVLPPDEEARLRAEIDRDPDARALLAALDAVIDDLAGLPPLRMPDRYASRLDAAIAAEASARSFPSQRTAPPVIPGELSSLLSAPGARPARRDGTGGPTGTAPAPPGSRPGPDLRAVRPAPAGPAAPPPGPPPVRPVQFGGARPAPATPPAGPGPVGGTVHSLDQARRRRRTLTGTIIGLAAAVAAFVVIGVSINGGRTAGEGVAASTAAATGAPAPNSSPVNAFEVDPDDFGTAYQRINGQHSGTLADPLAYASCLAANSLAQADVLGVSDVTYQGKPASAIVVATGPSTAQVLVVGQTCGPQGAQLLARSGSIPR
ncbi:hypothetical protein [Nakamurella endophytica]|uniref:Uncharacterized protein n=1 Tax=Nakamurella endophytica TaxID=1748367 RepID=A0A917WE20_9ACTN|nr:hypothetical protein [Nakamurella endophytica]GGL96873.1 hypothetical protein GCM10011594_15800 [Nakamurella endophytica]